jgi:hypothetical protein
MFFPMPTSSFPYALTVTSVPIRHMFRTKVVAHQLLRTAPDMVKVVRKINSKQETETFKTDLSDQQLLYLFQQMVGYVHNAVVNGMKIQKLKMPDSFYSNLMGSYMPIPEDVQSLMPEL